MNEFGEEYASQVVRNAKAFGKALYDREFKALCPNLGFTESHQVIVDVKEHGGGQKVASMMTQCNIICNKMALPHDTSKDATHNPSGIRLGVQELTRWGMKEKGMDAVADFYKRAIIDGEPIQKIKADVMVYKAQYPDIHYCFPLE